MLSSVILNIPWFPTDRRERTYPSAIQLVPSPGSHNLKVQCLIKLSQLFRLEPQSQNYLSIGWDNPAENAQSESRNPTILISKKKKKKPR